MGRDIGGAKGGRGEGGVWRGDHGPTLERREREREMLNGA